jgi:hypothetical protein
MVPTVSWLLPLFGAATLTAADLSTTLMVQAAATDGSPLIYTWRTVERPPTAGEPEFRPGLVEGQVLVHLPAAQPGRYGFTVHLAGDGVEADGGTVVVTVRPAGTDVDGGPTGSSGGGGGGGGGGCGLGSSVALLTAALALVGSRRKALR